jgi:hypothetical protein
MATPSRRLVIDASVGAAAGRTDFPTSRRSRAFLAEVLKISHQVVMTRELAREWDDHETRFSARWRVDMRSRRKVIDLENVENEEVRRQVRSSPAVLKDLHLVEAALATDHIVVSLDERAHRDLAVEATKDVVWVNAAQKGGHAIYWLRNGAPDKEEWKLGWSE